MQRRDFQKMVEYFDHQKDQNFKWEDVKGKLTSIDVFVRNAFDDTAFEIKDRSDSYWDANEIAILLHGKLLEHGEEVPFELWDWNKDASYWRRSIKETLNRKALGHESSLDFAYGYISALQKAKLISRYEADKLIREFATA